MFPQELNGSGNFINKGPSEAIARQIWIGESVHQMTILEMENAGEAPNGIVLALVGPELGYAKDVESPRTLRMYNLSSLVSLAKWATTSKDARPLDLYKSNSFNTSQDSPSKKHRQQHSIARSLKQFIEPQSPPRSNGLEIPGSHQKSHVHDSGLSPSTLNNRRPSSPIAPTKPDVLNLDSSSDSQWEFIDFENLPLRWANDYVPLASPGSRLVNQNILSYAFWCDENRKGRGGQLLAVTTRNNILLYETPKGERAFRFVKDFYTPLQPRSIAFFHQNVQVQQEFRSHRRTDSAVTFRNGNGNNARASYVPSTLQDYGNHLSLFVVFDKKAIWIRIADSAVGEMELYDDSLSSSPPHQHSHPAHYTHHVVGRDGFKDTMGSPTATVRRIRHSIETYAANKWTAPVTKCDLPFEPSTYFTPSQVLIMTRGRQTQVFPCPLPANYTCSPPLWTVHWRSPPTHVLGRICTSETEDSDLLPFLQIVAFSEGGIEVQEVPVSLLMPGKGKGKGRMTDLSHAHEDLGGPAGFLCKGGHWDDFVETYSMRVLSRHSSSSNVSLTSNNNYGSETLVKPKKQEGVYGWWCKDLQDWRVFWIGEIPSVDEDPGNASFKR